MAMAKLSAQQVADLLLEIGRRAQLEGGNPYKAKAYVRAAESLRHLARPLHEVIARGQLQELPGIGAAIGRRIVSLHRDCTDPWLEKSRSKYPAGLLELLSIPRLKPSSVVKLYATLGVASLQEIEKACREDRLKPIKGLGPALQRKILDGLAIARAGHGQLRMNQAWEVLEHGIADLQRHRPDLQHITITGDLRRGCEVIADLSLVAVAKAAANPSTQRLGAVTLHVAPPGDFATRLLYATGNRGHIARLEARARDKGLALTMDGLSKGPRRVATRDEVDIYKALGLPFIPPELREGGDEIDLAAKRRLPRLVEQSNLAGLLHVHTDFSDGMNSLEEMAEAARGLGYQYIGITDHSQSAHYAGGLRIDDILAQHAQIDALNIRYGNSFCIVKGIESDIRGDGSLDYPDDILARFDFVVASVHSQFRMDRAAQTSRIVAAVKNPFTTVLGHPTGRLLLRRPGYEVDIEPILAACGRVGVAVEINCNPNRLDLDWRWHRCALELGCTMSINPDAHSIRELGLVKWGIAMARKGAVPKQRILNTMSRQRMLAHLRARKARRQTERKPRQRIAS
jgi:DNA polymerase (family X)